jgi:tRNA modification GTPase
VKGEELAVLRACRLGLGGIVQLWCRGDDFREALAPFLKSKKGKSLEPGSVSEIQYCILNDGEEDIDEVLIGWYENRAEVNCHGGTLSAVSVIKMLESGGFREIKADEWWQGEVSSGRSDVFSAESYLAMERTETILQAAVLSKAFKINDKIAELKETGGDLDGFLKGLADTFSYGDFVLKKHVVALVGAPNAGKSTCFNSLLVKDRAMVSEIAGTTRDSVRHGAEIGGLAVELVDTAGLLGEAEGVDKIAVERAHDVIASADLRIMLFDSGRHLSDEDITCINSCRGLNTIYAGNKSDLEVKLKESSLQEHGIDKLDISISSLNSDLTALIELAGDFLWQGAGLKKDYGGGIEHMIATEKQFDCVKDLLEIKNT